MKHRKGVLISVEGIDGCGKTTLVNNLAERLTEIQERKVVKTSAISKWTTKVGEKVSNILCDVNTTIDYTAELLLMTAARVQNYKEIIEPALKRDEIVISDRYKHSMYAYQKDRYGVRMTENSVNKHLSKYGLSDKGDFAVFLDISPDNPRIKFDKNNRLEVRPEKEWHEMRQIMLDLTKKHPHHLIVNVDDIDPKGLAKYVANFIHRWYIKPFKPPHTTIWDNINL